MSPAIPPRSEGPSAAPILRPTAAGRFRGSERSMVMPVLSRFLYWSFPWGPLRRTSWRVSVFLPVLVLLVWPRAQNFAVAVVFVLLLGLAAAWHLAGHTVAAQLLGRPLSGGLVWPLGDLHAVPEFASRRDRMLIAAAGPAASLVGVLTGAWSLSDPATRAALLDPFTFPPLDLQDQVSTDLGVLWLRAHGTLLLINLVPFRPSDAGDLFAAALDRVEAEIPVDRLLAAGGAGCGVLVAGIGLFLNDAWIACLGAVFVAHNVARPGASGGSKWGPSETLHLDEEFAAAFSPVDDEEGDSAAGADPESAPTLGLLARWQARRRAERARRDREFEEQAARRLDELLEKVHAEGLESLTPEERQQLERAADRLRDRGRPAG